VRRSSADLRANLYLASGPVVTVGTAVEQEHERSFNVCQSSFGELQHAPDRLGALETPPSMRRP